MSGPLLDLAAALALLLIGLAMLRVSVLRISGGQLVTALVRVPPRQITAVAHGLAAGAGVRSSTLFARLLGPAVSNAALAPPQALAAMLVAEVGGGLAAVLLTANPAGAYQLLLVVGLLLFLAEGPMRAALGRALLGTALALMSLKLLGTLGTSLTHDRALSAIAGLLGNDLLLAATLGAAVSLLLRSSLATVLLLGLLGGHGVLPLDVAMAMVLGANLGSGILALTAGAKAPLEARQVAIGFFFVKAAFVAAALLVLHVARGWVAPGGTDGALVLAASHLLFNLVLALACAKGVGRLLSAVSRWLPRGSRAGAHDHARRLDPRALPVPSVALTCAVREVARLADMVEMMLRGLMQVLLRNDITLARSVRDMEDAVDGCYGEVKHYLAAVRRGHLAQDEERRWNETMTFAIALEQVADTVERVLRDLEARAPVSEGKFSSPAIAEVSGLHALLLHNLRMAVNLLLERDAKLAQALAAADKAFLDLERSYEAAHLKRLSAGDASSVALSAVYLDLLGDIERMNTLVCSLAACFLPARKRDPALPHHFS